MKKKTCFLALFLIFSHFIFAQATWQLVNSPVNEELVSVCFVDAQYGWILSEDGTLLRTENEGSSWESTSLGNGIFTSVHFTNQSHGCVVGSLDSSFIMITEDGGNSWTSIEHPKANHLNDVFFIDDMHGWTVGSFDDRNYNLYTADGGQSWDTQMDIFVIDGVLYSVSFRDELIGATCGADGIFMITNSGGSSGWALDISIPSLGVSLYGLYNWGALGGCAVGSNGTALYTINNWNQYIETNTNTNLKLNAVSGDGINKVWIVGQAGTILYTPSYLLGWTTQNSGVTEELFDLDMVDENNGWAVGSTGTILHYGIGSSVNEVGEEMFTIYPNPANGIILIEFYQSYDDVELYLYDITGKVVEQLKAVKQDFVRIDASDQPPGIYFVRVKTNKDIVTRKVQIF